MDIHETNINVLPADKRTPEIKNCDEQELSSKSVEIMAIEEKVGWDFEGVMDQLTTSPIMNGQTTKTLKETPPTSTSCADMRWSPAASETAKAVSQRKKLVFTPQKKKKQKELDLWSLQ